MILLSAFVQSANMSTSSRVFAIIALLMFGRCIGGTAVDKRSSLVDKTGVLINNPVNQNGMVEDDLEDQIGKLVSQVVEQHLAGCHLVLVETTEQSPTFFAMNRQLVKVGQGVMMVDVWRLYAEDLPVKDQLMRDQLLQGLWGDTTLTCSALIIHLDNITDNKIASRFLEWCKVWRRPMTRVVIVGVQEGEASILLHHNLRNTIHTIYLALHDLTLQRLNFRQGHPLNTRLRKTVAKRGDKAEELWVYGRCLYCNKGEAQVQLLHRGNLTYGLHGVNLFPDQRNNFMGHTLKVSVLAYVPLISYEPAKEPGAPVVPQDSLNIRMLHIIASHLNFTYELREPLDNNWGTPVGDGTWTGIVGDLQLEQADFSLDLTLSHSRSRVIDFSRVYNHDPLIIVSLKPAPLPRQLALTRPFVGDLWVAVMVCTLVLGFILWVLQWEWSKVSGGRGIKIVPAFLYSWGMMLAQPVTALPTNTTARVLMGWWLLTCVIVITAYRSSLIAHLSVQSKYPPINTFQDLLDRDGWSWGSRPLRGTTFLYFNQSSDPDIQEIFRKKQTYKREDGMERVLAGGFSFLSLKTWVKIQVTKIYTDRNRNSPFYISKTEYPIFGGNGWGFRQGAPFLGQLSKVKQQLMEAGLLKLWLDELIQTHSEFNNVKRDGNELPLYTEPPESTALILLLARAYAKLKTKRGVVLAPPT
ncbi:glutamate receptor ionotropic, kainate 3-like [Homarus americanus]|uniref:glutamate receptor ionotropic, kainate 3-like n=1 Tax=Homarus americanus TaxID=6706 RepID=UPI001C4484B5|nr:glutamate receptor ionotropic, kainate 3-like [Homarus americanus]